MARSKATSTNDSASNTKKSTMSKQSVSAIREQYKLEQERQKENFDKAIQGVRKLRDPNKNSTYTLRSYERETIRNLLKNPANNEVGLRNAVMYLYYRSQILYRIIHWYSGMWCLNCRKVIPKYSLVKDNDPQKMMKIYDNTLDQLDIYNIQGNWQDVAIRCYLEDVCYTIFFRDKGGAMFYILDPSECRIDGRYDSLEFSYSIDASKWKNGYRRELAEWLGEPFTTILKEHERTGEKWIHMPDEWGAAFKFNSDRVDAIIPPFAPILQSLAAINDLADIQALKDEASIYRLLLVPMKVLSGAKTSDDFEISPDLLLEYYEKMADILPEYVAAAPIPGEVTNDNVIDFSTTSADKDIDRYQESQDTILATAGGGAVLNANHITSTAAFNAWLKEESEFAISSLIPQIQGFTNRMLSYDVQGDPCKVEYFEITVYTRQELREELLKSCQYSYPNRLAYNTLNDISEKATLAMDYFENEVLKLHEKMVHPLQSSYTSSNTGEKGEVGEGRPQADDDTLSPSGERSRNQ